MFLPDGDPLHGGHLLLGVVQYLLAVFQELGEQVVHHGLVGGGMQALVDHAVEAVR
jgi:hypothetical protein